MYCHHLCVALRSIAWQRCFKWQELMPLTALTILKHQHFSEMPFHQGPQLTTVPHILPAAEMSSAGGIVGFRTWRHGQKMIRGCVWCVDHCRSKWLKIRAKMEPQFRAILVSRALKHPNFELIFDPPHILGITKFQNNMPFLDRGSDS